MTVDSKEINFLLSHFEPPAFPRRISTALSNNKQYAVYSIEEMLREFERADYIDCKVNAYRYLGSNFSIGGNGNGNGHNNHYHNHPPSTIDVAAKIQQKAKAEALPTVLFIDLDDRNALTSTRRRIKDAFIDDKLEPSVIDSGNGFHIVLPLETDPTKYSSPLPDTEEWRDIMLPGRNPTYAALIANALYRSGTEFQYYTISESFSPASLLLRFAEDMLTNNRADPAHTPSIKSCMVRVPGTYNKKRILAGKSDTEVKIVSRWNNDRKAHILPLINRFHAHLRELKAKRQRACILQERARRRQYRNRWRNDCSNAISSISTIPTHDHGSRYWYIDILMQTPIADFRKHAIDLLLVPYLVTIKKLPALLAENIILDWLNRCANLRPLDFDPVERVQSKIEYVQQANYFPLGEEKFKAQNYDLFIRLCNDRKLVVAGGN